MQLTQFATALGLLAGTALSVPHHPPHGDFTTLIPVPSIRNGTRHGNPPFPTPQVAQGLHGKHPGDGKHNHTHSGGSSWPYPTAPPPYIPQGGFPHGGRKHNHTHSGGSFGGPRPTPQIQQRWGGHHGGGGKHNYTQGGASGRPFPTPKPFEPQWGKGHGHHNHTHSGGGQVGPTSPPILPRMENHHGGGHHNHTQSGGSGRPFPTPPPFKPQWGKGHGHHNHTHGGGTGTGTFPWGGKGTAPPSPSYKPQY